MVMKKELALYDRDGEGKLIPKTVVLSLSKIDADNSPELLKEKIRIVPMPRGELKKVFNMDGKDTDEKPETDRDEDAEVIFKYCTEPKFTLDELIYAKPIIVRSIVRTIFEESGITFNDNNGTKRITDNDEFGKNSLELDENTKKDV